MSHSYMDNIRNRSTLATLPALEGESGVVMFDGNILAKNPDDAFLEDEYMDRLNALITMVVDISILHQRGTKLHIEITDGYLEDHRPDSPDKHHHRTYEFQVEHSLQEDIQLYIPPELPNPADELGITSQRLMDTDTQDAIKLLLTLLYAQRCIVSSRLRELGQDMTKVRVREEDRIGLEPARTVYNWDTNRRRHKFIQRRTNKDSHERVASSLSVSALFEGQYRPWITNKVLRMLDRQDIRTVGALAKMTPNDILSHRDMGKKALEYIIERLKSVGMSLNINEDILQRINVDVRK